MTDKAIKEKTAIDIRENPYNASKLKNSNAIDGEKKIYKKRITKKHSGNFFLILSLVFGITATCGIVFGVHYKTKKSEPSKFYTRKRPEIGVQSEKVVKKEPPTPVVPVAVKPPPLKVDKQEQTDLPFDDLKYNMVLQEEREQQANKMQTNPTPQLWQPRQANMINTPSNTLPSNHFSNNPPGAESLINAPNQKINTNYDEAQSDLLVPYTVTPAQSVELQSESNTNTQTALSSESEADLSDGVPSDFEVSDEEMTMCYPLQFVPDDYYDDTEVSGSDEDNAPAPNNGNTYT